MQHSSSFVGSFSNVLISGLATRPCESAYVSPISPMNLAWSDGPKSKRVLIDTCHTCGVGRWGVRSGVAGAARLDRRLPHRHEHVEGEGHQQTQRHQQLRAARPQHRHREEAAEAVGFVRARRRRVRRQRAADRRAVAQAGLGGAILLLRERRPPLAQAVAVGAVGAVGHGLGRRLGRRQHEQQDGGEEDANRGEAEGLGVGFDEQRGEERPRHEREAERHAELADGAGALGVGAALLVDVVGDERLRHREVLVEERQRDDREPHPRQRVEPAVDPEREERGGGAEPEHRRAAEAVGRAADQRRAHQREPRAQRRLPALAQRVAARLRSSRARLHEGEGDGRRGDGGEDGDREEQHAAVRRAAWRHSWPNQRCPPSSAAVFSAASQSAWPRRFDRGRATAGATSADGDCGQGWQQRERLGRRWRWRRTAPGKPAGERRRQHRAHLQ